MHAEGTGEPEVDVEPASVEVHLDAGRLVVRCAEVSGPRLVTIAPRVPTDARAVQAVASAAVRHSGRRLSVSLTDPGGRGRAGQVLVTVQVPTGTSVVADAGEAEVVCTGTLGTLDATTSSGSVHAEVVAGSLTVRTGRGPVTVHRCGGPTSVSTSSGVVVLREVAGPAVLANRAGDVHVWWLGAPAQVVTSSGNVRLGWQRGRPVHLDLATTGGRLRVSVPDDPDAATTLRVSTIAGDVWVEPADPLG